MKRALLGMALLLGLSGNANATTFTVVNTNDSGAGSLRECMQAVSDNPPGPHRIVFAIAGAGVKIIQVFTPLPELTTTVSLDGTSQPGYNQTPLIEINDQGGAYPIIVSAANSSVKGIAFNNFTDPCVFINADVCSVSSCFFGTNAAGTAMIQNTGAGIYVNAKRALIGGHTPAFRNIISGSATGVYLTTTAGEDTVINNYIGTDVTGTVAFANDMGIYSSAPGIVIEGNLISGNTFHGILADCQPGSLAPGDGHRIDRNLIGTDASGLRALPNGENGIQLSCDYSIVGGVGRGNVISGNDVGIAIDGNSSYNEIRGNKIGVSSDGTLPLGNSFSGISLTFSHDNVIGGSKADGSGNLIGANGSFGISIFGSTATDNAILGNAVGSSFNGAASLGNWDFGIRIESDRNTVGGLGELANVIAHNNGGVLVNSLENPIRGNAIFDNSFNMGINLGPSTGVEFNDSLDGDFGANQLQNFPMIAAVSQVGDQVRLQGHLSSVPSRTFALDFFSNRVCGSDDQGEGESWLGTTGVITNASGLGLFDVQFPITSAVGYFFTATATDNVGNTSEFSPCAPLGFVPTATEPGALHFALGAGAPSPARGTTSLPFTLPVPAHVSLRVYDVSGRRIATLAEGEREAGPHRAEWSVEGVAAGTYFCRLEASAKDGSGQRFEASRTVVVVR